MLIDSSRSDEWNSFVAHSRRPTVMQTWQWGQLKSATGWIPHIVAIENDSNEIVAGALVLQRQLPIVSRSILYAPRGPIVDFTNNARFTAVMEELRGLARRQGGIVLTVDPCVPAENTDAVEALEDEGFQFSGTDDPDLGGTQPRYVMKTDLTDEPDELLAEFKSKWRYNVRLAGRKGVDVRIGDREDLNEFYRLLQMTAERHEFNIRDFQYFQRLYDTLVDGDMAELFVAEHDDTIISAAILFAIGDEAVYVYGASDYEARDLMANHLMQWEMMQWTREHGCRTYDFRGVSREVDGEPIGELGGLNRFKRGFNAEYVEYIGEYDLVFSPIYNSLYRLGRRLRDI